MGLAVLGGPSVPTLLAAMVLYLSPWSMPSGVGPTERLLCSWGWCWPWGLGAVIPRKTGAAGVGFRGHWPGAYFQDRSAGPAALLGLFLVARLTHREMPAGRPATDLGRCRARAGADPGRRHGLPDPYSSPGADGPNWSEWWQAFTLQPTAWLWGLVRLLSDEPLLVLLEAVATLWLWRRPQPATARAAWGRQGWCCCSWPWGKDR